ncbi:restriction system protein [Alloalcanivorax xenomutans]|uniref:restriction endonuclease n=1 Tax=Alloalcanivorax xenomutans TaxID=1094342 RepID=UPI000BD32F1A|nr:restriction endonuclease [Alloalcanivorax xenomutans]SOC01036.1 restriction system protein [Alloalcanivorax xenomutans]
MPIPDFQSVMRPMLVSINDGSPKLMAEVQEDVCTHFRLTKEERAQRLPSGKQTYIKNRVGWARTYMKKAGLLTSPGKGLIQITDRGRKAMEDCPERITVRYLKNYQEFVDFHTRSPREENTERQDVETSSDTPDEQLQQAHTSLMESLADELLDTITAATPSFFEKLVVDLMLAMGYGGSREDAGQATRYTSDGGIDGIIKEDPLGLDVIYLQAKRYTEKVVGRPEVQGFAGALDMQRARKGVFITTSKFSGDARDYVGRIEKKIVLIDGQELAKLMIQYNLGVGIKETYEVKQVDSDYFNEE